MTAVPSWGNIWQCREIFLLSGAGRATRLQSVKARNAANILQCPGQAPATKDYSAKMPVVLRFGNPTLWCQKLGKHICAFQKLGDNMKSRAGFPDHFSILLCPQRRYNFGWKIIGLVQVFFFLSYFFKYTQTLQKKIIAVS